MQCAVPELNDLAGGYSAGRLTAAEQERFELHLLECEACQAEVRMAAAVRAAASSARGRGRLRLGLVALPPLAAAALILIVLSRNPYGELGRLEGPAAYQVMEVRARGGPLLAADSGLAAYGRADYRQAEAQLARAGAEGGEPGIQFFLGVARLMLERPAAAVAPLREAIRAGPSPYAAEARYYLAKAFLQLERPDSAAAYLLQLQGDTTATGRDAARLLQRLQQVRR